MDGGKNLVFDLTPFVLMLITILLYILSHSNIAVTY